MRVKPSAIWDSTLDLIQIVPMFGNFAYMIVAFVVALSVIVAIHELGHYIVGRWCGIHADVFSLGFGPVIYSRVDKRGTRWQIAALPVGGYVKFMGDANAASVGSDGKVAEADMRRTMPGAPLWARAATAAAGPIFNFILAIAILAGLFMFHGRVSEPLTFGELRDLPPSYMSELRDGDVMLAVEGQLFDDPMRTVSLADVLPPKERLSYTIIRDGREMIVEGPHYFPPVVSLVHPRSAADDADIEMNDVILAIDGEEVFAFAQVQEIVPAANGKELTFTIWRDGEILEKTVSPRRSDVAQPTGGFETRWLVGIQGRVFFEPNVDKIGPVEAFGYASDSVWAMLKTSMSALKHIALGKISTCNLSGPIGIAETSKTMAEQGPINYINLIAGLSAAVGLINLFPIPILDGGHLLFYAYEAVARRKPSDGAVQVFMFVGLSLILSMMMFTVLNDTILCP
jgi:regulator of sigma E protease